MKKIYDKHLLFWKDRTMRFHFIVSLVFLCLSLFVTYGAFAYTNTYSGNVIPDLLLDHIPVFNVNFFFFQGAVIFLGIVVLVLLCEPKYIPFTVATTALFFALRSAFMVMTHLSAPGMATYQYFDYEHHVRQVIFTLSSGNDLFFSGHSGYPFLLALIFWKYPRVRVLFLLCSLAGAAVVILGHLHYSIDVFSAYFIAYGIFKIAQYTFKKEFALLG